MAWEWVAPTATGVSAGLGMFFTWLTGSQSRKQAEKVAAKQGQKTERDRVMQERRNAYFTALEIASIDLLRIRYQREGQDEKLADIERKWPKSQRTQIGLQATTGVEVYGSRAGRSFLQRWSQAMSTEDEAELNRVYEEGLALVRRELGAETLGDEFGGF